MKIKSASLFYKALLAVVLLLLPILITFLHGYRNNKEYLKKYVLDDLTVIAKVYEGQVYQFIEMSRRRVQDFSSDGMIRKTLEGVIDGSASPRSLSEYLVRNKLALDKTIERILVVTPDGRVAASTDPEYAGRDVSGEVFFLSWKKGVDVVSLEAGPGKKTELAVSAPLFGASGKKAIGVMTNFVEISELDRLLGGGFTGETGARPRDEAGRGAMDVYLVNGDRRMIASSKFVRGRAMSRMVDTEPVRRCLESGGETAGFYRNYGGVEVAGASTCIKSMGWVLLSEAHAGDILAPAALMRREALIAAAVVAGMIMVMFAVFYRSVLARLRLLAGALKDVAHGDYGVALPVFSGDEIGALSGSFNEMADDIRQRTALLAESEGRLKAIIDNSRAVIYLKDAQGRFILTNRRHEELFNPNGEDVRGKTDFDVFPPEAASKFRENDIRVLESGAAFEFEESVPQKDGIHYYISNKVPIFDASGAAFAVCGISTDITERKLMEDARMEIQRRYEELVNNLTVGIYRCTGEKGRFIEVNKAFVEMFEGASKEDVLRRGMSDLYQDKSRCEYLKSWIAETGSVMDESVEMVTLNGRRFWASVTAVMRKGGDGDLYCDGFIEDITRRKRLEEQLLQSQKMEAVGLLAGGIAHDFNNILTALIGYGNLLLMKKGDDESVRTYADHILALSEKAASLTQGLLAFSRKQIMNPRPTDINDLVKKAGKILLRLIGEDIELWINVTEKKVTVKADAVQIEQVLMNLATNARDAMPAGGVLIISTDTVRLDEEFIKAHGGAEAGEYAVISFSDTGAGMDGATKNRIFEPFFTTKDIDKGTGLGLSVAYGIINQHNGFIDVNSSPGLGTKFNIYLPLTQEQAQKSEAVTHAHHQAGKETVLIVEDEGEVREMVKALLEEFKYTVVEARDGEEAVRKYAGAGDDIDLIVMDIVMPRKNGMEACNEIKKINPAVKILFTSGYDADIVRVKGVFGPGMDFISKPASPAEFLKKIREVLDR